MADLGPPPNVAAIVNVDQAAAQQQPLPGRDLAPDESGPLVPYGPPIHAAAKRGDLAEMEAVANAARLALAAGNPNYAGAARGIDAVPGAVSFTPVTERNEGAVIAALASLDNAIAQLKQQQGSR